MERKKNQTSKIIIFVALGLLAFFSAIGPTLYAMMHGIKDEARTEIDLLQSGHITEAYQAGSYSMKKIITLDEFRRNLNLSPLNFTNIEDYTFNRIAVQDNRGELSGSVTFKNDLEGDITVQMIKENKQWKLLSVELVEFR
ncbi:hypothetical protein SJZ84_07520 [Hafnia paralvei]|uniref:hypothetical protein n=1 Tax=Hafnia TaxID=568 RepID=UPI0001F06693|nr:hypothetical protein [Hafnia paralvei]EFV40241.1 hypothetical protein HMPREF0864_01972 [Enterobacteriaceae bacterium 9_2_54FAA]MBU2674963.1 hypothetical protein [Hafnia paralvei]MBW2957265.1 hypothetical protein [Hafnia paralvei]MCQ4170991.1 hypothetical protein [Hafnia paralvei]MDX6910670.1 hypothetical protein [Hafnia paralvei]